MTSGSSKLQERLTALPLTTVRWGLERTAAMLESLGHPERSFRSLHVGGTNGKGSTAALLASALGEAGHRTGLYTSPELLEFRDRFRVGGVPLPEEELEACARQVIPLAHRHGATFFEAATVLAFQAFRRAGVEWAVVEVGVGGRLDATNVLAPEAVAVTTVSRDHEAWLGGTLREIAVEKAGILKAGVPAVVGPVGPETASVFGDRARRVGAPLVRVGTDVKATGIRGDVRGTEFDYRSPGPLGGRRYRLPLAGAHQAWNAAVALAVLETLEPPVPVRAVERGLEGVHWPGRCQVVRTEEGPWFLDVAHNPEALEAALTTLDRLGLPGPRVFLLAILADKAWRELVGTALAGGARGVFTVSGVSPPSRRWDPARAAETAPGGRGEVVLPFGGALRRARELAGDGTVVVTGSGYAVAEALRLLGEERVGAGGRAPRIRE